VSDVEQELDAAREAGWRTALCVRHPTRAEPGDHPIVRTFDDVEPSG